MFDMTPSYTECPACEKHFTPARSNQQYCSPSCQKRATRHAVRNFRHLENFARDELEAARARELREMLYSAPPSERLGIMKNIIDATYHDGGLRNILSRPELLADRDFSAGRGQMNIAKAANAYCKKFLQMSGRSYIRHVRSQLKAKSLCELLAFHIEVVKDKQQHGPIPELRPKLTKKNVKCIHKIHPEDDPEHQSDADFERVARICEEVQARVDVIDPNSSPSSDPLGDHNEDKVLFSIDGRHRVKSEKSDAKRKIALSRVCFDKGISIDSGVGRTLAASMGIRGL